jgi:hypothetical protein
VIKLLILVALALVVWKMAMGRWPWEPKLSDGRAGMRQRAQALLGVQPGAARQDILDAHRNLIARVHPDRGGSNELVHEANAARDLLLADVPVPARD